MNKMDFTKPRINAKLLPWQVTGFVDAEGSFSCYLRFKSTKLSLFSNEISSTAKLEFKVTQKSHSVGILYELQDFFKCGSVVIDNRKTDTKKFHVTSLSAILTNIIPHFDLYPCLTSKNLNFSDWKRIALMLSEKKHKQIEYLIEINNLASGLNKKRTFEDKYLYCKSSLDMGLQSNGEINVNYLLPNHWVQGFLDGEGTFYTYFKEKKSRNIPYQGLDSSLEIGQNNHDIAILLALRKFFNGGYIKPKYDFNELSSCIMSCSVNRYILRDTDKIIQFVDQYPMITRKQLDYLSWKEIVNLKSIKAHKTPKGIIQIKNILNNMNSKRK